MIRDEDLKVTMVGVISKLAISIVITAFSKPRYDKLPLEHQ